MKKIRLGGLMMGTGALLCAVACAAPLLGLGALGLGAWGLAAGLEWAAWGLLGLGALVTLVALVRRRPAGCGEGSGGTDAC